MSFTSTVSFQRRVFFFPHSEEIYIRHLKTNKGICIIIIYFFTQASRRNPTTWSRFTASFSTLSLALEPDGTCVSLEEWQREMLEANCWFYHSNTKFVTPVYRSQGKQLYCGSIFHSMAVLGIKVSFYDGKNASLFYLLLKIKKYRYYNAFWGFATPNLYSFMRYSELFWLSPSLWLNNQFSSHLLKRILL